MRRLLYESDVIKLGLNKSYSMLALNTYEALREAPQQNVFTHYSHIWTYESKGVMAGYIEYFPLIPQ